LKQQITLHIGEYYGSAEPVIIKTLLGSCVAVCLFDPAMNIGGMNHIYLPGRADLKHFDVSARFGINAMELLINRILSLGGDWGRLVAKAFGGANVFPGFSIENSIGRKISEFVRTFLETEGIPLVGSSLGGAHGRQVFFHTDTGDVFIKKIQKIRPNAFKVMEEQALERAGKAVQTSGRITIFQ